MRNIEIKNILERLQDLFCMHRPVSNALYELCSDEGAEINSENQILLINSVITSCMEIQQSPGRKFNPGFSLKSVSLQRSMLNLFIYCYLSVLDSILLVIKQVI